MKISTSGEKPPRQTFELLLTRVALLLHLVDGGHVCELVCEDEVARGGDFTIARSSSV